MTHTDLTYAYDNAAPKWDAKMRKLGYLAAYQGFLSHLTRRPVTRLCDMGAGTGGLTAAYLTQATCPRDVTLVDPSATMLDAATQRLPFARPVTALLEDFTDPSGFDLILASHVIEHCADPSTAMQTLATLIRPGGTLALIVSRPHWCQWFIWLRWRHRWYAAPDVMSWAEAAGLRLRHLHSFDAGPPSRTSLGYILEKPERALP